MSRGTQFLRSVLCGVCLVVLTCNCVNAQGLWQGTAPFTAATLAVPGMILGETPLSFLGIGLRPPIVSWGVLLQRAQNYQAVVMAPWLLLPSLCVIVVVLAFNLLGDGLRDAADPYH